MRLINIINELVVNNIKESIKFYQENLGFRIELAQEVVEPYTWIQMSKGNVTIMLEDYNCVCKEILNFPKKLDTSNLLKFKYDNNKEIKDMYHKFKENKIDFFMELKETKYGDIEFGILDPDKNMIIISAQRGE